MSFEYVGVEDAINRKGLRMVVVGGIPSAWGEAAKGILHVERIDWAAVRLDYESEALKSWAGGRSGPVAIFDDERPRSGWAEILLLAERLAQTPSLLPKDPETRALVFGLAHEICGEAGLGWSRRLQLVHAGLASGNGFSPRVATYLAKKYGYSPAAGAASGARVAELLRMLSDRLMAQRGRGKRYYVGDTLTALDVYGATFIAMFAPLPVEHCNMDPGMRAAFETRDAETEAALDPILLAHRDMMYAEHLELPLSL